MRFRVLFCALFVFALGCRAADRMVSNVATSTYPSQIANAANIIDTNQPFHRYMWLTAHNAFATPGRVGIFNQAWSIEEQLKNGVRGLMLDVYAWGGSVRLCHGGCTHAGVKLSDVLEKVSVFLSQNQEAVIMINFEEYVNHEQMQGAFNERPGFAKYVFNPKQWLDHNDWPSLQEMIDKDQRLFLLVQREEQSSKSTAYDNDVYVFHDWDITSENVYRIGSQVKHNTQCHSRWGEPEHAMDQIESSDENTLKWTRLFVMNHFHSTPNMLHAPHDNAWGSISARVENECAQAQRRPNYVAVDFVEQGDVIEYVELMNNGGIIAFSKESTEKIQCGFSTAFVRTLTLNRTNDDRSRLGCENDKTKAIKLLGMKAGERVTFYDNVPENDREKAKTVLTIKQDIPFDKPILIMDLNTTVDNPIYTLAHSGGNVDGKVSVVKIEALEGSGLQH